MKVIPHRRSDYRWFLQVPTRWADNDVYGHVNNTAYYGFFDTAVNCYLIENAGLDIHQGAQIGLVVHTACDYFAPLAFPQRLDVGLRADRVGNSSVAYGLGVFATGEDRASAQGEFVHVYVDRQSRKAAPLADEFRCAVLAIKGGRG